MARTPHTAATTANLSLLAVLAAFGGAALQTLAHIAAHFLPDRTPLVNPDIVWLAPLANLTVAVPVVLAVGMVFARWRPGWAFGYAVGASVTLALLPVAFLVRERISALALVLLCVGVATVLTRLAVRRPGVVMRLVRVGALTLVILMLGAGAVRHALRAYAERRAFVELPRTQEGAPNVLLLILDTVRAMSLSGYGYSRETSPHLDALAAEGVRFERAVATASYTLPTHATLFTGRFPHQTSVRWGGPLDDEAPTLAEVLGRRGYATGGFAANLLYCTRAFGLARGFATYRDYVTTPGEALRGSALTDALIELFVNPVLPDYIPGRPTATQVSDRFLRWQERVSRTGRPFFAFLNVYDAHGPYVAPPPFDTMFTGRRPELRHPHIDGKEYTAQEAATLRDAYDTSIRYLDAQLEQLFAELERRGVLENTIVIVTADHGEEFFEHGLVGHGDGLHFPSLHVPLIIRFPRSVPQGMVIPAPVTLRDVPSTILELTGASEPHEIHGRSLAAHWRDQAGETAHTGSIILSELDGSPSLPPSRPVSKGDMYSVVSNGLHLIRRGDGHEEMYDVISDPLEGFDLLARRVNLDDPRVRQVRNELTPFLSSLERR